MSGESKSLKSQNLRWLCGIAVLDMAILGVGSLTSATVAELPSTQPYWALVLPVVILLLASLVPSETKAKLVYWRWRYVLPGHRAFTHFAHGDSRIDTDRLRASLGDLPIAPRKQNNTWYQLYLGVKSDPAVIESHKLFLLFRDAAAMSILLCLALFALGWVTPFATFARIAAAVFLAQYLLCVVAARNNGNRLITNVLAIHSQQRT
jgi:hypothetical protein